MNALAMNTKIRMLKIESKAKTEIRRFALRPPIFFGSSKVGILSGRGIQISGFGFRMSVFAFLCLLLLAGVLPLRATISEPDNIIYGSVVIGNTPVTAADTDVVIEAQRTPGGAVIASYRMGSDPGVGNFYSLTLKMESVGSVVDTNASTIGAQLVIVLKNNSGVVGQTLYTFPERGHVQRVDFGAPLEDADGNGLPDLWELTYLGGVANDPNALGFNGQTLLQNYIAGTNPEDPEDVFSLNINRPGGVVAVSFLARRAEGPGYAGKVRSYALESRPALASGIWSPVPGYQGMLGDNQTITFNSAGVGPMTVFRGKVNLVAVQLPGGPRLSIERMAGNGIRLSWPSASVGFALEENSNLNATTWTNVTMVPVDDGTNWSVILNPPGGSRFYRLRE